MQDTFISLKDAAVFEGTDYHTLYRRMQRNPNQYETKTQAREAGGKDQVLISVTSLSAKARRAWRAARKTEGRELVMDSRKGTAPPWYVTADLNEYIAKHEAEYKAAVESAAEVQRFILYDGPEKRADVAARLAERLGISVQSLYRHQAEVLEASAWAMRLEREDGADHSYFRILALCRKPREKDAFPSLTAEQRAIIENIWFGGGFVENQSPLTELYRVFEEQAAARGWAEWPSARTVNRYVKYLMSLPAAQSAHYLAENGFQAWENAMQVKGKRDASTLAVMEYVVADAHTFDVWVEYTAANGKKKAIRPVGVMWEDMKTRRLVGVVICEHSNTQVVKQSFVKMCYETGTAPKHAHMDNGKDFANWETLGQNRKVRAMQLEAMDAELTGFYRALGTEAWSRSLPYKPWDKPIERAFKTFCMRFSKKFASYVGTLTGSRTSAKIDKPIQKMLERGELLTLEEFYDIFTRFLNEWYDTHKHRGLKDAGEKWTTPLSLWENAEHYEKALPPKEYALMLMMKPARAKVMNQGIYRFNTLYTAPELGLYIKKWVNIRWDPEDMTRLYVYAEDGKKVCEAYSAELLQFGGKVDQEQLAELFKRKKHNEREVRQFLEDMRTPPELRTGEGSPAVVGALDLTIGHKRKDKVIALPADKEFRGEMAAKRKSESSFLETKGEAALERLMASNN